MISPHEWEEQGARLLAYDEELTLVEVLYPTHSDTVLAKCTEVTPAMNLSRLFHCSPVDTVLTIVTSVIDAYVPIPNNYLHFLLKRILVRRTELYNNRTERLKCQWCPSTRTHK